MADEQSPETLKQMLAGFNAMQMQLGLLPNMRNGQQPMGVPLGAPPPPPMIPHPSEAAQNAFQQQQMMMQQTLQTAQATRYTPPPSAPTPSTGGGFNPTWGPMLGAAQAGQANPYLAQAMGGMPGMPSPGMMTSPAFGLYRGHAAPAPFMAPPNYAANVPSYYAPFAPMMPGANFMMPHQQRYAMMGAHQSQGLGTVGAAFGGGMGFAGSMLGSAFGPIGSIVGGMAGSALGGTMIDPVIDDIRRGRQLQNVMSPWMVSGGQLNMFTGTGMERQAAQQTAHMLRTMTQDHDMRRLGFNTQDVMRITQLSADQGLLQTAQNPDHIAQQVKNISKAVKALVQITGDPDVRNAIASLGQMRVMGFEGLASQTGAVANRAIFARMAGVSQQQMAQFEAAGAMQATQMGLSGATGIRAAQFGAGMANVAASSGTVEGLALARAGGQQGLAQTLGRAQMASAAFDPYLMAAVEKGPGGMHLNMDLYRANQGKSLSEVMGIAGEHMNALGPRGMLEFRRRRAELGERALQGMSPTEQMLMPLRQARAIQQDVGDLDLGSAFEVLAQRTGMSAGELQAMQQVYTDPRMYRGTMQQLRVQQRRAADQERAKREGYRTPGTLRQIGRGVSDAFGSLSEALTSPFTSLAEASQRADEDIAAQANGEVVFRSSESELMQTERDRRVARASRLTGFGRTSQAAGLAGTSFVDNGRSLNRWNPFSAWNDANQLVRIGHEAEGGLFGIATSFGRVDSARARVVATSEAGQASARAQSMSTQQAIDMMQNLQRRGQAAAKGNFNITTLMDTAMTRAMSKIGQAGLFSTAEAMHSDVLKNEIIRGAKETGMSDSEALSFWNNNKADLLAAGARRAYQSGDPKQIENWKKAEDIAAKAGIIGGHQTREQFEQALTSEYKRVGLESGFGSGSWITDAAVENVKKLAKNTDPKALAYAAANAVLHNKGDLSGGAASGAIERARKFIEQAEKGLSIADKEKLRDQAKDIGGGLDKRSRYALMNMIASGHGDVGEQFQHLQDVVGVGMDKTAQFKGLARLQTQTKIEELSSLSTEDALKRLSTSDLSGAPANIRKIAAAYRDAGGDSKKRAAILSQFQDALSSVGGEEGTTSIMSGEGGDVARYDEDIASLRKARNEMANTPEGQAQAVLADSAVVLGDAAKDLKDTANRLTLWLDRHQE